MSAKKPGDVVIVEFPFDGSGSKFRPAIVLEVMGSMTGGNWLRVAYGTSQRVDAIADGEFAITGKSPDAFGLSGLRKDTKFVLTLHVNVAASRAKVIGSVHEKLMRNFYKAAKSAGLI